jgi:putative protease
MRSRQGWIRRVHSATVSTVKRQPELIAPAGNMECARAAVANGADAVYFGLQRFNARMRADNFTEETLPELIRFLHEHRVRAFCTLNTLVFTDELPAAERELILLDEAGVDAVLVQDIGVAALARELGLRLEVHASTQMTVTSPEGVKFAERLGITRVVVARETSLRELARFRCRASAPLASDESTAGGAAALQFSDGVGLEVFVHGALCVAYSGQCLTSEALGQRSANRGECAQACRLPYELIVDGVLKDLGDRRYLLSPQDLAAVNEIPELIRLGVLGFKIEGRLKTPEYVAATCQVYRKAIDQAISGQPSEVSQTEQDNYKLEMTFSRGLYSGWMHGVNYQELVHARFGKKRGPFVGFVKQVGPDFVELDSAGMGAPFQARSDGPQSAAGGCADVRPSEVTRLRPGDGIVFDTGGDIDHEQGGRVWEVHGDRFYFERGHIDFSKLKPGDRVWKTSDPQLDRVLKKTFQGNIPRPKTPLDITVTGAVGKSLTIEASGVRVSSAVTLQTAYKRPLTKKLLREQLGRLGETDFVLGELHNLLDGQVILPVSELNRLRRELVLKISAVALGEYGNDGGNEDGGRRPPLQLEKLLAGVQTQRDQPPVAQNPQLVALCRTMDQITAALDTGCGTLYVDFEDIRRYADAVGLVRSRSTLDALRPTVYLATPRIQKAGEQGFFKVIESAKPDGILIRNLGALDYFRNKTARPAVAPYRLIGDFSLNVANPLTADVLMREGFERLTVSYDCNAQQVLALLQAAPPWWFELAIHQHMPMFHMEHCVFAAFLSDGTDATNCGRPCDVHNLKLRDRVGMEHPVKADVGCRNTVFHARAQSGAEFLRSFVDAGASVFRVELLEEDAAQSKRVLQSYRELIDGAMQDPAELSRRLHVVRQLGVTSGTLTVLG